MAASNWMGLALVLLVLATTSVSALRCYTCNSSDNMECLAPPRNFTEEEYRDNRTIPGRLLVECPAKDEEGREPFCRTQFLLVIGGSVNDHSRVWRECGYDRSRKPCYRLANGGHEELVCQCFTDGCNGGARNSASIVALLISSGLLLRFSFRSS